MGCRVRSRGDEAAVRARRSSQPQPRPCTRMAIRRAARSRARFTRRRRLWGISSSELCVDHRFTGSRRRGHWGGRLRSRTTKTGRIFARSVLLATGGLGRVFKETTNPDVATGDGIATAYRAGAVISDIEFVQFHPTALFVPNAPRFLLTEALRGEGGRLLNASGEEFMKRYDERGELAPRDIVSRSIVAEMRRTNSHVYLDLTHMDAGFVRGRFPRVFETCLKHGVDITAAPVPVHPAAHYAMGGVRTDIYGRTSVSRLFAAGEAACSGVHGANRLASNSLLEGLVFGARAGVAMRQTNSVGDTSKALSRSKNLFRKFPRPPCVN